MVVHTRILLLLPLCASCTYVHAFFKFHLQYLILYRR
jgi:hypothetical protein